MEFSQREIDMGILDSVKGVLGGGASGATGGSGGEDLSSLAASLLGEGGKELPALLDKFQTADLGNLIQSWVGKGANLPASGEQVKSVLGSDAISGIAAKLGISGDQAAAKIAAVLPQLIDKITPDGVVPDPQALSEKVMGLLKQ